jgi:hypothetical protein
VNGLGIGWDEALDNWIEDYTVGDPDEDEEDD